MDPIRVSFSYSGNNLQLSYNHCICILKYLVHCFEEMSDVIPHIYWVIFYRINHFIYSHRDGPGSRLGNMWGLWWTKRHWDRFSPSTSVSPANHHNHTGLAQ
jgi:hypothetical protein